MSPESELRAALWLSPRRNSPLFHVLRQTIAGMAPIFDDAPEFDPHVTLVTGINVAGQRDVDFVLDTAVTAAKSVPHLDVRLNKVTYGRQYFRKVVFEADRSPELVSLATIAQEEFVKFPQATKQLLSKIGKTENRHGIETQASQEASEYASKWANEEFRPHLSLVYSNLDPVSEATRETVHQRLTDVFGPNYETRGIGWTGGEIKLVLCAGPVEEWKELGSRIVN